MIYNQVPQGRIQLRVQTGLVSTRRGKSAGKFPDEEVAAFSLLKTFLSIARSVPSLETLSYVMLHCSDIGPVPLTPITNRHRKSFLYQDITLPHSKGDPYEYNKG
jgi:hypothetical protein